MLPHAHTAISLKFSVLKAVPVGKMSTGFMLFYLIYFLQKSKLATVCYCELHGAGFIVLNYEHFCFTTAGGT